MINEKKVYLSLIVLVLIISGIYVFYNYNSWLTSDCIAPVGADVKFHVATVYLFLEHLKAYRGIYPIDYLEDTAGLFWYYRSPVPILLPALANLFLSFNASFFLIYLLAYIAVIIALFFLASTLTDKYTAFYIAVFFLFSAASNMTFSVGGNYQFFIGLIFVLLSLKFFYLYAQNKSKKYFIAFYLSAVLLGLSYTLSFLFMTAFFIIYTAHKRDLKLLYAAVAVILTIGLFIVPLYATRGLPREDSALSFGFSPVGILKQYILPSDFTGWVYKANTEYRGQLDFNYGPHIYLLGLVFFILLWRKERTPQYSYIKAYWYSMLLLLAVGFITRLVNLGFINEFYSGFNSERLMYHVYLSFLLIVAYGVHRFSIVHWKSLIPVTLISMVALGTGLFKSKIFFALLPFYAVVILREFFVKSKIKKEIIISSIVVFLLLFPLSGKVETTNLGPRPGSMNIEGISDYIGPGEIFYFKGGWSLEQIILSCAKARSTTQIDHDGAISGLNSEIDILNPSIETKNKIEFRGINKVVIALDQIMDNDKIDPNKVAHLVSWYGEPKIFQLKNYYPFIIFETKVKERVKREMESPVIIHFSNADKKDSFLTDLEYHPWWRAYSGDAPVGIKNSEGFVEVLDTSNVDRITLKFSLRYFILGAVVSLIGIVTFVFMIRKKLYG